MFKNWIKLVFSSFKSMLLMLLTVKIHYKKNTYEFERDSTHIINMVVVFNYHNNILKL